MLKKIISCALIACLVLGLLAACAGQPATPPADSGTDTPGDVNGNDEMTARDRVYALMERDPIRFAGIPPQRLADRAHIDKGVMNQEPRDSLRIGMSLGYIGAPFFIVMEAELRRMLEEAGHELVLQVYDRDLEVAGQQVDAFISLEMDAIFLHGNALALAAAYRRSAEAGIPLIATSNMSADEMGFQTTNVLSNSYASGFNTGAYTARRVFDPANPDRVFNIAWIINMVGSDSSETRGKAFTAGFLYAMHYMEGNPYPSIWYAMLDAYDLWDAFMRAGSLNAPEWRLNFLGFGQAETPDAPGGMRAANDLIVAHGQNMDILWLDACAMFIGGAEVVLMQHNLVPGQDFYMVAAADATRATMELLKEGKFLALGYNSSAITAMVAMQVIEGIFKDGDLDRMNNLVANFLTPGPVVTMGNVDDFFDPDSYLARPFPITLITVSEYNAAVDPHAPPFEMVGMTVPIVG
ncbi:MAG: substrate-binding domain-containing protein [Oscillospiraceae bacterium]|nr:substrate-binding domain-containing protein [Oscillospiraceae bacterium]